MQQDSLREGLALLANPNVLKLFIAYLISFTGTAMAPIAMAFGVLELTGSTADASYVIAAPAVAATIILLIGGVVADRTSRQRGIVIAEVVAMAAQLAMGWLFLSEQATLPLLIVLMLINGAAIAFHSPASSGLIIQLVERHQLQSINALLGMARHGALALGAALGGLLVATVGPGWTLLMDGISFGLSAVLVLSMRPQAQTKNAPVTVVTELREGWQEFTSHTWLWTVVLQFALLVAALEAFFGLIGPAITQQYMNGSKDWGYLVASFGIGTVLGGFIAMRLKPRYPMRFGVICILSFALLPLAMIAPLDLSVLMVLALLVGVADQQFSVIWYTTLQTRIPPAMLSRVSAYDHMGSIALAPLGILAGGLIYEQLGPTITLILTSVLVVVPTIAVLFVRDVWQMRATDSPLR